MATSQFEITTPEGDRYVIDAPSGATEEQAISWFKENVYKPKASKEPAAVARSQFSVPTKENIAESQRVAKEQERGRLAKTPYSGSMLEKPIGAGEAALQVATGIPVSLVAPLYGAYKAKDQFGTKEGVKEAEKAAGEFAEKYTFQPKTEFGQKLSRGIATVAQELPALTPLAGLPRPSIQRAIRPAVSEVATKAAEPVKAAAQQVKEKLPTVPRIPTGEAVARKSAEGLRKELGLEGTTAQSLAERLTTRRELGLRGAGEKFKSQAAQQREASARQFADLGTPTSEGALGDQMQQRIVGTEFRRESSRSRQAASDFKDYFDQAKGFEESPQRQQMLSRLQSMSESSEAGSAGRAAAAKALRDLQDSTTAIGAEKEFRKYYEGASAPPAPGYGEIERQASKSVSDIIGNALNEYAPKRIEARKTYAEYSTPLDAYETLLGKKAVAVEKGVPERLATQPSSYPKNYFKNRDTINALREQLAGDEAAVRKFANQYTVNELQGLNAKSARTWLNNNSSWLDTVEGLRTRVNRYVDNLDAAERQAETLEKRGGLVQKKATSIVEQGAKTREKIQQDLRELQLVDDKKVATKASQIVDDLERQKLISKENARSIRQQIETVDKNYEAAEKRRQIIDVVIKRAILGALGYGAYETYQAVTKD